MGPKPAINKTLTPPICCMGLSCGHSDSKADGRVASQEKKGISPQRTQRPGKAFTATGAKVATEEAGVIAESAEEMGREAVFEVDGADRRHKSSGFRPVCLAIFFSMTGPISTLVVECPSEIRETGPHELTMRAIFLFMRWLLLPADALEGFEDLPGFRAGPVGHATSNWKDCSGHACFQFCRRSHAKPEPSLSVPLPIGSCRKP